jgi:hypothetical protein
MLQERLNDDDVLRVRLRAAEWLRLSTDCSSGTGPRVPEEWITNPRPPNPLICYLSVDGDHADVVHHRPHHAHETLRLEPGLWEVRRPREWSPEEPVGQVVVD